MTLAHERKTMREWIETGGSWGPPVVTEAQRQFDSAVARLAELGLREEELREWFEESLFRVDWWASA